MRIVMKPYCHKLCIFLFFILFQCTYSDISHKKTSSSTADTGHEPQNLLQSADSEYSKLETKSEKYQEAKKKYSSFENQAESTQDNNFIKYLWMGEIVENTEDNNEKEKFSTQLQNEINDTLSPIDLRKIFEAGAPKSFIRELVLVKLIRYLSHVGQLKESLDLVKIFYNEFPSSKYLSLVSSTESFIENRFIVHPQKIGLLVPLSGKFSAYGLNILESVQLAMFAEQTNFELIVKDTAGDSDQTIRMVEELVVKDHVMAIIGPVLQHTSLVAGVMAQSLQVPILTLSRRDGLAELGDYVFRHCLSDDSQTDALVQFMSERFGIKNYAVLFPNHPYGEELKDSFVKSVEKKKGAVTRMEKYPFDQTTFSEQVKKLVGTYYYAGRKDYQEAVNECKTQFPPGSYKFKKCSEKAQKTLPPWINFGALFIPDYAHAVSLITPALAFEDIVVETDKEELEKIKKALGRDVRVVKLIGGNGWNSYDLVERAGRYVEGAMFSEGFYANDNRDIVKRFTAQFRNYFHRTPQLEEAQAYDSVVIINEVLKKYNPKSRDAFKKALSNLNDFEVTTGNIHFDSAGNTYREVYILTIKNGQIVKYSEVFPDNASHNLNDTD